MKFLYKNSTRWAKLWNHGSTDLCCAEVRSQRSGWKKESCVLFFYICIMVPTTTEWLIIFLLIVSVGYIFLKKDQRVKKKWSLERLIHYVLRGIGINLVFLLFASLLNKIPALVKFFIDSLDLSAALNDSLGLQNTGLILFSIGYFAILILFTVCLRKMLTSFFKWFWR